jgi:flagellar protein FliT
MESRIELYEAIARASGLMLEAACAPDPAAFSSASSRCAALIERLRGSRAPDLRLDERRRRHEILLAILAHDAQLRELANPGLRELESLLQGRPNGA